MRMEAKRCSKCREDKPLESFHRASVEKAGRHGLQAYCKECTRAREKNRPPRVRTDDKAYFANIKRLYGLCRADYEAMFERQQGRCASCSDGPQENVTRRFLHVDHCHETLKVRGLLCLACNVALGKLRDDIARVQALGDYLERTRV